LWYEFGYGFEGAQMAADNVSRVGQTAPKFALPASTGETIELSDFRDRKMVVLYFYPRADTPGCTKEACGFRDALEGFDKQKIAVLGISPDPIEDVTSFAKKFHLNFPLLADADHAVAERYGVWHAKSMYGKRYWGVARTTFVIDKDGKILRVFERVKPAGHERQVLEWIAANK
jgi:thioredoxin-dependent peroxiredoxin